MLEFIDVLISGKFITEHSGQFGTYYKIYNLENTVEYRLFKSNSDDKWYISLKLNIPEPEVKGIYVLDELHNSDDLNNWINSIRKEGINSKFNLGFKIKKNKNG